LGGGGSCLEKTAKREDCVTKACTEKEKNSFVIGTGGNKQQANGGGSGEKKERYSPTGQIGRSCPWWGICELSQEEVEEERRVGPEHKSWKTKANKKRGAAGGGGSRGWGNRKRKRERV